MTQWLWNTEIQMSIQSYPYWTAQDPTLLPHQETIPCECSLSMASSLLVKISHFLVHYFAHYKLRNNYHQQQPNKKKNQPNPAPAVTQSPNCCMKGKGKFLVPNTQTDDEQLCKLKSKKVLNLTRSQLRSAWFCNPNFDQKIGAALQLRVKHQQPQLSCAKQSLEHRIQERNHIFWCIISVITN